MKKRIRRHNEETATVERKPKPGKPAVLIPPRRKPQSGRGR